MKKYIYLLIITLSIFYFSSISSFAQSGRVIKEDEVGKVVLKMYHILGKFSGYLIFYDKAGNECAVNIPPYTYKEYGVHSTHKPTLFGETKNHSTLIEELEITPDRFHVFKLRNGDEVYGYEIDFLSPTNLSSGEIVSFRFSSHFFTATYTCSITTP